MNDCDLVPSRDLCGRAPLVGTDAVDIAKERRNKLDAPPLPLARLRP